ncbi:MAG: MucR family transcriptional regulator [Alphaproteobacteria bacterium]|nr:MucR family transcriptional regulator [Alphaproteobacteria bacterium]
MSESFTNEDLLAFTTEIVSSHVSRNETTAIELPKLIQDVYRALASVNAADADTEHLQPAVPVKKSVFPDYIICLEDGKKLKMLKRHLKTAYHMTPEEYRVRWNLPADYPMVAPNYAERRSGLAKKIGLGVRSKK